MSEEHNTPTSNVKEAGEGNGEQESSGESSSNVEATSPPREKMIETAMKFLLNPQVRKSPLSQKKAFLQKKGLTAEEIEIAVDRSGTREDIPVSTATQPPPVASAAPPPNQPPGDRPYNAQMVPYQPPPPPVVKSRFETWRDYAALAVVISGVSYGFYKLYEKFLQPLLVSRQEEKLRQERLEQSIQELSTSVKEAVNEMQRSLTSIKTILEQQQGKFDQLTLDISTNKSVIATGRSADASDLKAEITSLKGLMLNRHQFPATPQPTPIPAWQRAPVNQETTPSMEPRQETSPSPNPPITGTQGEVDPTQNGNALSNSSELDNHDDTPANSSIDNGEASIVSTVNGQGKGGSTHDNLDQPVNQNGITIHNEDASVEVANGET